MLSAQYPAVLRSYVGDDGYAALVSMLDDRQQEYMNALDESVRVNKEHFAVIHQRFEAIDQKFDFMAERMERRFAEEFGHLRVELHDGFGGLRTEMAFQRADLMKWAMVFWVSQAAAVAGIIVALR
jgi:hypothetical protein